jgi:hypothetical protein
MFYGNGSWALWQWLPWKRAYTHAHIHAHTRTYSHVHTGGRQVCKGGSARFLGGDGRHEDCL